MKFWVWTSIDREATDEALVAKYSQLRANGITGVFLAEGIDDREFEIIRSSGLELHCWMITTNCREPEVREEHPEWYMVSRSGKSSLTDPPYVHYYRWLSPILLEVRDHITARARHLAEHPLVQGVHLDYVRYPDVILPVALWKEYGLDQSEEMADFDFDYSDRVREIVRGDIGLDPLQIADPAHDQAWLHYRYKSVTRLVDQVTQAVHGQRKEITAAVFPTPSIARKICRQDWDKWSLDLFCPMIYHSFYNEPLEWIGQCMLENIAATSVPICAGLYMPAFDSPEDFAQGLQIVRDRGGAGVSLFGDVDNDYWQVFRQFVSSV
ncbi:MAG: family 10 glycosylhydrolase [Armatimonadota bacterium]